MSKEFNEEVDVGEDSRSKCESSSEWTPSSHMLFPSRGNLLIYFGDILLGS